MNMDNPFGAGPQNPGQADPQGQLNVDIGTIPNFKCMECGHEIFIHAFLVKRISPLQSPTGQESFGTLPTLVCMNCKTSLNDSAERYRNGERQKG